MHHERPWRDPEGMRRIAETRGRIRQSGQTRAARGIAELEVEEGAGVVRR
jgi:hypothetical protein